jgi:aconitate hydratase
MCPEYGAIVGYFAADEMLIQHLINTGRKKETVEYIREYLKAVKLIRDYKNESANNDDSDRKMFTQIYELDLSTVLPCVSGPKRPMDKTVVSDLKESFKECLTNKNGFNVSIILLKLVSNF